MRFVVGVTVDITSRKQHELELGAVANAERSARERTDASARATGHSRTGVR